jgi:hypothetical protein
MAENYTNASAIATVIYDKWIDAGLPGCYPLLPASIFMIVLLCVSIAVSLFMFGWLVATYRINWDCRRLLDIQGIPGQQKDEALLKFLDRHIYYGVTVGEREIQSC